MVRKTGTPKRNAEASAHESIRKRQKAMWKEEGKQDTKARARVTAKTIDDAFTRNFKKDIPDMVEVLANRLHGPQVDGTWADGLTENTCKWFKIKFGAHTFSSAVKKMMTADDGWHPFTKTVTPESKHIYISHYVERGGALGELNGDHTSPVLWLRFVYQVLGSIQKGTVGWLSRETFTPFSYRTFMLLTAPGKELVRDKYIRKDAKGVKVREKLLPADHLSVIFAAAEDKMILETPLKCNRMSARIPLLRLAAAPAAPAAAPAAHAPAVPAPAPAPVPAPAAPAPAAPAAAPAGSLIVNVKIKDVKIKDPARTARSRGAARCSECNIWKRTSCKQCPK